MMRTLFSGILGLRAHQTEMDVIGNNVANVNTSGYKAQRTVFQDILSQTVGFSSAPTSSRGGINATQIGLGTTVSSVDNIFTQGALQTTGRDNDVAIQGDGFFIVKNGDEQQYTRAGTFDIDGNSNLIHSGTGNLLMGWSSYEDSFTKEVKINSTKPISTLNIKDREKLSAKATDYVEYRSNLTASAEERSLPEKRILNFYDSEGNEQEVTFNFVKIDKHNWNWIAVDDTEGQVGNGVLTFDDNGKIVNSTGGPLMAFDPDGASGTPPELSLQANNTAGLTDAIFRPLIAERWSMSESFTSGANLVNSDLVRISSVYKESAPADPLTDFDMRSLNDPGFVGKSAQLYVGGKDGNGDIVDETFMNVTSDTKIRDVVRFLDQTFPNATASFNPNTGKIEMQDASAGEAHVNEIFMRFDDPNYNPLAPPYPEMVFPGLSVNPLGTPTGAISGQYGWQRDIVGDGTVKDGVHSVTIERIDATPSQIPGEKTGLTRFTTFAELGIGDTSNFTISIDGSPFQQIYGLVEGNRAEFEGGSVRAVGGTNDNDIYTSGSVTINGYQIPWSDADLGGGVPAGGAGPYLPIRSNADSFSKMVVDKVNAFMQTVPEDQRVFANYNVDTNKVKFTHIKRGADKKITISGISNANPSTMQLGFSNDTRSGTNGSTTGDLIDAVNNQVPGALMEIQGDKVVLKRSVTGAQFDIDLSGGPGSNINGAFANNAAMVAGLQPLPANGTYGILDPGDASIANVLFSAQNPVTTQGTDRTFTLTDLFTPTDGTGTVALTYNDFKAGQTIGNDDIGQIILDSTGLQPGTTTITTKGEQDATTARIAVPTINAYSAEFTVQTGGKAINNLSVAMIKGAQHVASTSVYDSLGNPHVMNMTFEKIEANKWQYATSLDIDDELMQRYFESHPIEGDAPTELELSFAADTILKDRRGTLVFNEFGRIDTEKTSGANGVNLPDLTKEIEFSPLDAKTVSISADMLAVTQFDSGFSTAARSQNGYEMGMLNSFEVTGSGVIVGTYTNGFKRDVGQVAVALFSNSAGLEKQGDSMFSQSSNSGLVQIGAADTGGRGLLQSQTLEMSNVDLAQEFTTMIIAQRGFQANAKSITTADEFLQELINLKR